MAILDVVYYGDSRLEKVSEPVTEFNSDLRKFPEPVLLRGFHIKPEQIGIRANGRGQRANHHRRKLGEQIALHHEGGARLTIVAGRGDRHKSFAPDYGSGHW